MTESNSTSENPSPEVASDSSSQATHPLDQPDLPKRSLLSYLAFIPAALIFILLLVLFELLQIICGLFDANLERKSRAVLQKGFYYYLYLLGVKYDIRLPSELDPDRPYILVSNHQSMFDIPLLFVVFGPKEPRYIAKVELGRGVPTISRYLRNDGSALIQRENPRQSIPAVKALAKRASAEKFAIAIFPEGTRARAGVLKRFRPTGLKILLQHAPEAIVLPVAIDGSWKFTCYPKGPIPLGVNVSLWTGKEIDRQTKTTEEIIAECESQVRTMLREIRTIHG